MILPAFLPNLFVIMRINLFGAWLGVLTAEMVGVRAGLGAIVVVGRQMMNMNLTFLGMAMIGLVSYLLDAGFALVQKPVLWWKSTMLMMLAGLEMPTSGTIIYNGEPITGPASNRFLIFQQPSLYPWLSTIDNVVFGLMLKGVGRKERRQRAEQFLRQVVGADFERYRALFVEPLRSEVTKAFQERELAEMLDMRIE